jgi:hypothetical protein
MSSLTVTGNASGAAVFTIAAPGTATSRTLTLPDETATLATQAYASNAGNLSTGTVPTARLGSSTASSSTFLRGDQTWAAVPPGPSTDFGGVGSYAILLRPINNTLGVGGTEAGSNLRYNWAVNVPTGGVATDTSLHTGGRYRVYESGYDGGGTALSGTWRRMDGAGITFFSVTSTDPKGGTSTVYYWLPSLYVRIS